MSKPGFFCSDILAIRPNRLLSIDVSCSLSVHGRWASLNSTGPLRPARMDLTGSRSAAFITRKGWGDDSTQRVPVDKHHTRTAYRRGSRARPCGWIYRPAASPNQQTCEEERRENASTISFLYTVQDTTISSYVIFPKGRRHYPPCAGNNAQSILIFDGKAYGDHGGGGVVGGANMSGTKASAGLPVFS